MAGPSISAALLASCLRDTRSYEPEALADLREQVLAQPGSKPATTFAVVNETTLQGCARLIASQQHQRVGILNFASAKNPGGGFLGGARAQEESLARSSALYFSLRQCPEYYAFHRAQDTCLYSDRMIYSPACPVFRDDAGQWLAEPYVVDVITSPAPNAGAILHNEPANRHKIVPTLAERAGKILALAASWQCDTLVLGAWGCGVFSNNPIDVAAVFYGYLRPGASIASASATSSFQSMTHRARTRPTRRLPASLPIWSEEALQRASDFAIKISGLPRPLASGITPTMTKPCF